MDMQWTPILRCGVIGDHHPSIISIPGEQRKCYASPTDGYWFDWLCPVQAFGQTVQVISCKILPLPLVVFHCVGSSWVSRQEFQSFFPVCMGNAISYGLNAVHRDDIGQACCYGSNPKRNRRRKRKTTTVMFKVYVHWFYVILSHYFISICTHVLLSKYPSSGG